MDVVSCGGACCDPDGEAVTHRTNCTSPVTSVVKIPATSHVSDMNILEHAGSQSVAASASSVLLAAANSAFKQAQTNAASANDAHVNSSALKIPPSNSEPIGKPAVLSHSVVKSISGGMHMHTSNGSVSTYVAGAQTSSPPHLVSGPFPHPHVNLHHGFHAFPSNSDVVPSARRGNSSTAALPATAANTTAIPSASHHHANNHRKPSTPTNLTPSSSSSASSAPSSAASLSPNLSPASNSVPYSASAALSGGAVILASSASSPGLGAVADVDSEISSQAPSTVVTGSTASLSLRSGVPIQNASGNSASARSLPRLQPLLYPPGAAVALHPAYYSHEPAFYPATYFPHATPHALSQAADYEYSAHAMRLASNAAAAAAQPAGPVGGVYPPEVLAYPYPYPAMYPPPPLAAQGYPIYYPYPHQHPHHQQSHPSTASSYYEHANAAAALPSTQKSAVISSSIQRNSDNQSNPAIAAFGSTDEINHTLSTVPPMLAANESFPSAKPAGSSGAASGNAANGASARTGMKRRKRPVSSLEEMLYRLSEFSVMEKRLKSKNKACATLGYSKGTINSYIDKVHAALESGVELSMMGPLTAFDIRRMIHKRSEGKKEQQEKLVHHQQRKKQKTEQHQGQQGSDHADTNTQSATPAQDAGQAYVRDSQTKLEDVSVAQLKSDDDDDQSGDNDADGDDDDDSTAMDHAPALLQQSRNAADSKDLQADSSSSSSGACVADKAITVTTVSSALTAAAVS